MVRSTYANASNLALKPPKIRNIDNSKSFSDISGLRTVRMCRIGSKNRQKGAFFGAPIVRTGAQRKDIH